MVEDSSLEFSHQSSRSNYRNNLKNKLASRPELEKFFKQASKVSTGKRQFQEISNLNEVFGDDSNAKISHKEGQILFIDVWATWCGPCQGPMQHNQDIKTKNKALWGDLVRIACISLDDNKDDVIKRVNSKKWKSLEHYQVEGGWNPEHNIMKQFQTKGIPKGILVNSAGDVVFEGHPLQSTLKEK